MDFLFRSDAPSYQGKGKTKGKTPPTGATGFLAGLWCALFGGGGAPAYRSKGGTSGATAPTASPCLQGLSETPQYKTPPEPTSDPEPEVPPCGEPEADERDEPEVVPPEIHIYPGG